MEKAKIAVVGLGVMGQNLVLNFANHGYPVVVYNRTHSTTKEFVENSAKGKDIVGTFSYQELTEHLETPRRILLMVKSGPAVDAVISDLQPYLEPGDIIIDGGNSFFEDTERRNKSLKERGLLYLGAGVSGGEEGALHGPSIMPGGSQEAWFAVKDIFKDAAAKADDGEPCVDFIGPGGSGHYVKMVHNGIEYGVMQLIAEIYDLLSRGLGMQADELSALFASWNKGELNSYLIEITAEVLKKIDPQTGKPLVDVIMDEAQQKGTGKWTSQNALDLGAATHTINAGVSSRIISGMKAERVNASKVINVPKVSFTGDRQSLIDAAKNALFTSIIITYTQGFHLMQLASEAYGYALNMHEIAKIWRAGCIIRAELLQDIMAAYKRQPQLPNLLVDDHFRLDIVKKQADLRFVITMAVELGIPVYGLGASLAYFDAYRSERLPANLTQAQRDYFGAHTYRRVDQAGVFHTEW